MRNGPPLLFANRHFVWSSLFATSALLANYAWYGKLERVARAGAAMVVVVLIISLSEVIDLRFQNAWRCDRETPAIAIRLTGWILLITLAVVQFVPVFHRL